MTNKPKLEPVDIAALVGLDGAKLIDLLTLLQVRVP